MGTVLMEQPPVKEGKTLLTPYTQDPEEGLSLVLSSVNIETEVITLSLCLDDEPKTGNGIRKLFSHNVGDTWVPRLSSFSSYCRRAFRDAGFVAETTLHPSGKRSSKAWKITPDGKKYGQPIAAFTLRYAVENNISIHELLGQSSSPADSSPPYNRIRLLEKLRESGPGLRRLDLKNALGLNGSSVARNLKTMESLGFLDYSSLDCEKSGRIVYRWSEGRDPDEARAVKRHVKLTARVAEMMSVIRESNCSELAELLGYSNSGEISRTLSGLERQGLVERPAGFISNKKHSDASILQPGLDFLSNYSDKVRGALSGGPELEMMSEMQQVFENDYTTRMEYAHRGVELYREASPSGKRRTGEKMVEELLGFIEKYPDKRGPRRRDIFKSCGDMQQYIPELLESGVLIKTSSGKEVRYTAPEPAAVCCV